MGSLTAPPQRFDGRRLRQLREARGMRREALALAVGRSFGALALYERGAASPPAVILGRLAAALGCEVGDLFTTAAVDDAAA